MKLKAALSGGLVLHSPNYGREFVVQTDTSDQGMGVVLCQVDDNREEHPIAYYSRKFLQGKRNIAQWRSSVWQ